MAVRNDVTIDWNVSPRIITVADTSDEITIQDLHDTVAYMEWLPNNMPFPHIISSAGKEALGGSVYVGVTMTLQNAKLEFEDRGGPTFVQCNVSGGNLVAVDDVGDEMDPIQTSDYTQVVRTSSSSATLQELADIQYASFNGGVTVDITSSYTGSEYPTGTPRQPVNNLTDAMTIAGERGFTTIFIIGDATIDSGGDYTGMIFVGESPTKSTLTLNAAATLTNCEFYEAEITGTLDGNARLKNCLIGTINYVYGVIEQCILGTGTTTLGGSSAAHFLDCWSGVPGTSTPVIDLGGSGQDLNVRNYNGGLKLQNLTASQDVSVDMNSGHLNLDSTITNGTIVVRGVGKLTDNSGGTATVQSEWLVQGDDLANTSKMAFNKATLSGNTLTIYEDDGVTVWKTFDLSSGGRVEN